MTKDGQRGFIALFSVMIISFTLLILTISLNVSSILGRFNILGSEVKEESTEAADACVELARLVRVLEEGSPGGMSDTLTIEQDVEDKDDRFCTFNFTSNVEVEICAEVYDSYTFYTATFDSNNMITSFEEVDSISGICPVS